MSNWVIKKNRIDMDYNQVLQEYQVLLASKWLVPITLFGIIFQIEKDIAFFSVGLFVAYLAYKSLIDKTVIVKRKLTSYKTKVSKLKIDNLTV